MLIISLTRIIFSDGHWNVHLDKVKDEKNHQDKPSKHIYLDEFQHWSAPPAVTSGKISVSVNQLFFFSLGTLKIIRKSAGFKGDFFQRNVAKNKNLTRTTFSSEPRDYLRYRRTGNSNRTWITVYEHKIFHERYSFRNILNPRPPRYVEKQFIFSEHNQHLRILLLHAVCVVSAVRLTSSSLEFTTRVRLSVL